MTKVELFWMLCTAGYVSLLAAFCVLLAYKLGIVEWLQTHGSKKVSEMAHCDFCMCWWVSVVITAAVLVIMADPLMVFVPFIATPMARHLMS